ncbi:hypothetical protein ACWCP6_34720 [Streptomyces sp. NPDC002004]
MRPLSVPARLAAAMVAVAATAGCMSVSDDGIRPAPSHSAGARESGGAGPDGVTSVTGTGAGTRGGHERRGKKAHPDDDASSSTSPSASGADDKPSSTKPSRSGGSGKPGRPRRTPTPTPTKPDTTPTHDSPDPTPPEPTPPPDPGPGPTTAEPSSSAHEQAAEYTSLEPSPRAGAPV